MHLIRCALFAAAASALAPPSVSVRAPISLKAVLQDSTIAVDERSFAGDKTLPTLCETVATPGVQWSADVAQTLVEPGPELLSTLTMPVPHHIKTKKGSGLVLAKDEKGEDVYVPDPQSSRLCEELVALEGVSNPEDLWLLVRDVPGHILVPKLSAAIAYQKSAPKGDFAQYFLDTLVPKVEEAIKAAPDLYSASKAMSDVSHDGVYLGGGCYRTVDLLDNKNLKVIPGVVVFHLAVGRRGDRHNSIFTRSCETGKAIVESLRRVYAVAGYLPEIVVVQESWAINGCDMVGVHRSVKDDVVTYVVRVGPLNTSSTCASLHAVDATGSSHAGTPSTSRSARSTRWRLRYGERCGRRPRAST